MRQHVTVVMAVIGLRACGHWAEVQQMVSRPGTAAASHAGNQTSPRFAVWAS